jgi:U3 small nucleolar RNA-associated protein 3
MGKKRKASGPVQRVTSPEKSVKLSLNTWEDIADEQDEFLLNRDKLLLDEGMVAKRRRRVGEEGKSCTSKALASS